MGPRGGWGLWTGFFDCIMIRSGRVPTRPISIYTDHRPLTHSSTLSALAPLLLPPRQPTPASHDEVKAWLLPNGATLCIDQGFIDYTGWSAQDMVGKSISVVAADPGELERWVGVGLGGLGVLDWAWIGVVAG